MCVCLNIHHHNNFVIDVQHCWLKNLAFEYSSSSQASFVVYLCRSIMIIYTQLLKWTKISCLLLLLLYFILSEEKKDKIPNWNSVCAKLFTCDFVHFSVSHSNFNNFFVHCRDDDLFICVCVCVEHILPAGGLHIDDDVGLIH